MSSSSSSSLDISSPDSLPQPLHDVVIVGAGLCGLLIAYRLHQAGLRPLVVEAKQEIGGRISTVSYQGVVGEYGGTWFGPQHQQLRSLLQELAIPVTPQLSEGVTIQQVHPHFPPQILDASPFAPDTQRVLGGSERIIQTLQRALLAESILTNWPVQHIERGDDHLLLHRVPSGHGATPAPSCLRAKKLLSLVRQKICSAIFLSRRLSIPIGNSKLSKSLPGWDTRENVSAGSVSHSGENISSLANNPAALDS